MWHHLVRSIALVLAVAVGVACSSPTEPGDGPPALLLELPRALTAGEIGIAAASNRFAFDHLREIAVSDPGANVFLSPLSISMALGMTMNGAAGQTYDEMYQGLRLDGLAPAEVNASYRSLLDLLRGLDSRTELLVANSIWHERTFPFHESFLASSREWFDAEVAALDFADPRSVDLINDWVDRSTKSRIPKVLDEIDSDLVMFLINAIYFKGSWRNRFDPSATATATFHAAAGARQVPLMYQEGTFSYAAGDGYQLVELPYGNAAFVMDVVLPSPESDIATMVASLTAERWTTLTRSLGTARVQLHLPRFTLKLRRKLNADLQAMGMRLPFQRRMADFTGMSPEGRDLFIDFVQHDSYVDVNEEGTEAAAVTTVGVGVVCACEPPLVTMRVDRPFLFAIRERHSGTILFLGVIEEPPAGTGG